MPYENTRSICSDQGRYVASLISFIDTDGGSREITNRSSTSGDRSANSITLAL